MQTKKIGSLSTIILLIFAIACSLPGQKKTESDETPSEKMTVAVSLPVGRIIPEVPLLSDSTLSFALYIPSSYSKKKKSPVLIFFDTQGRGTLPLELYRENADHFGYILLCSNNSKNGNPPDFTKHIINNMILEATSRLSVDSDRVYAGGFSGGGRIAALSAFMNPVIKGVIGIGAGFPGEQMPVHPFRFIGIARKEDFNYTELMRLDQQLEINKNPHIFFIYNGKHDWCPADIIYKAMALFEFDAMRNKNIPLNTSLLDEINKTNSSQASHLKSDQRLMEAYKLYQYMLECGQGLAETTAVENQIKQLQQNKNWQKQQQQMNLLTAEEESLSQKLMQSIGKPLNWWQDELNKQFMQITAAPGSEHSYMLKRVLAALSVQCYMIIQQVLYAADLEKTNYIVSLYKMVEPEYKDSWYFAAVLDARTGNTQKCFEDLNTAIEKGFNDRNKMLNESAFQSLQSETGFAALLSKIPIR